MKLTKQQKTGREGGKQSAANLSPEARKLRAKLAAERRWHGRAADSEPLAKAIDESKVHHALDAIISRAGRNDDHDFCARMHRTLDRMINQINRQRDRELLHRALDVALDAEEGL